MKVTLPRAVPAFATTLAFKSGIPAKKAMRLARPYRHVFAYMPGGVLTHACDGQIATGPNNGGPMTVGAALKINPDGSKELKNFSYIANLLDAPSRKELRAEDVSRGNYAQWMGAEVARLNYSDRAGSLLLVSLSREQVIRSVANTLGGSHPLSGQASPESARQFDQAVHELLKFSVGGLPLPYLILLKAAQDILELAPKLLGDR